MKKGFLFTSFIFICIVAFWSSVSTGCANIVPPMGGPRDSTPPELLKAEPRDSSVNFRGKTVNLDFDEFVDLKDIRNNLFSTPTFENDPKISARGRTLTINFQDSLLPNTTYVLNFGDAIVDMNEGNVLKNFIYAFSTGPKMDSLKISGRVLLAENASVDSTLIVVLQKNFNDSAVRNDRPRYVVRVDHDGYFQFNYLPKDTFAIYALGGATFSKKYQNADQLFAFYNRPVVADKPDSINLFAYRESPAQVRPLPENTRFALSERRLRFNPGTNPQDLLADYVLNFPIPLRGFESTKIQLTADSNFNPVKYTVVIDTAKKELRFKTNWKENAKYNLVLQKDFATDTSGRQLLKTDTLIFNTRKQTDYGKLTLRIRNLDTTRNPVLLFVLNNQVVLSAPIKSGFFSSALFLPGEYELRILYDTNNNGKWDPGRFFSSNKRQPELVKPIQQRITVKPAWENEFDREAPR